MASLAVSQKELDKRHFILNGNIWKVVFIISFPLFLYAILSYLYTFVDTLVSNMFGGKEAGTAVASIAQVTNMIAAIGQGLAAGGAILIAREIGRNNYEKAKTYSSIMFTLVFIVSFLYLVIFIPFAKPIMLAFGVPKTSIDIGYNYFIVNIINQSIVLINTVFIGVQKAKGSTELISIFNITIVFVKLGLTFLFIFLVLRTTKEDKNLITTLIGLATLLSNLILFLVIVFGFLIRKSYIFHYSIKDLKNSFLGISKKITFISFPIFLGKFIFSLGKVVINGMAKGYGENVVGALGVSNSMGGMGTTSLSSIEDSESSIISQNIGNQNYKRALDCFYVGLVINVSIASLAVILLSIFNDQVVSLYATKYTFEDGKIIGTLDQEYFELISNIFLYEKMGIITLGINSAVLGLLYGFGFTRLSMVINVMRVFLFRIPSLFFMQTVFPKFGFDIGWKSVGVAMGFSNAMIGLVALIAAIAVIIKIKKQIKIKEEVKNMLNQQQKEKVEKFIKTYLTNYTYYKADKNIKWCYEDGVTLNGALDMYEATKDKFYLDFVINHYDDCIDSNGVIKTYSAEEKNIDNVEEGYTLYRLNQIVHKEKYQKAIKELARQLTIMPRTQSGSFWHKQIYPHQIWLDGLYMGLPFYSQIATEHLSLEMKRDIINQFKNVDKYNYDSQTDSFLHCYDEAKVMQWANKETGRSPNVWLRAVGWVSMACCDVYDVFRSHKSVLMANYLKTLLKKVLNSLKKREDKETKLYYDLVNLPDVKGNYLETSGSLMVAYSYLKGARLKMLEPQEALDGVDILSSVINKYLTETDLENICRVSGLDNKKRDGSVEYYLSEEICTNDPKGVGPLMMAYSEYLKFIK